MPKSFKFEIDRSTRRYLEKHQAADRMNKRISSITNLDLKTANLMEVFSYRVGGQYEPHYDFLKVNYIFKYLCANIRSFKFYIYIH